MKLLQLHNQAAVYLGNLILLLVLLITLSAALVLTAIIPLGRFQTAIIASGPAKTASLKQISALQIDLPTTANPVSGRLAGKLTASANLAPQAKLTDLSNFVAHVSNGQSEVIRGVYAPQLFAFPVIQQPKNNPIFVSNKHNLVTQFQNASRNNVTGLLAHNYLAGSLFYKLAPGHEVMIVYGDSAIQHYRVISIHNFQKLNPASLQSRLIDLSTGEELATAEVFNRFYRGQHHIVLQTCLKHNGRWDWGLTFVVATPL